MRTVFVTFQKEGIHNYPNAPERVEYLKHPHRHIFHFRVEIEVFHDDRDIEFIMFKQDLLDFYGEEGHMEIHYKSCEMLADELLTVVGSEYPNRDITIEVSEDGENGSRVYYKKDE